MYLGQLDINEYFRPQGSRVVYQTTTYPRSMVNYSIGTRWCQNVKTFKSKWMFCRTRVVIVGPPEKEAGGLRGVSNDVPGKAK